MVRITSTGGYDDGMRIRRQRIGTKFGTKIPWGMSIERLMRRSMDNICIHIRDLVNMGDGSSGSKLYCLAGCSITALKLQLTHYSSGDKKNRKPVRKAGLGPGTN
jgi:hypothetical protein